MSETPLTDDELYSLFLLVDDLARIYRGRDDLTNRMRERLLPIYRDWHAANPHKVHPVSKARLVEDPHEAIEAFFMNAAAMQAAVHSE